MFHSVISPLHEHMLKEESDNPEGGEGVLEHCRMNNKWNIIKIGGRRDRKQSQNTAAR